MDMALLPVESFQIHMHFSVPEHARYLGFQNTKTTHVATQNVPAVTLSFKWPGPASDPLSYIPAVHISPTDGPPYTYPLLMARLTLIPY
jgi:hypothetical protein